jgi:uncharacterized phage protein (TIGR02218 family)
VEISLTNGSKINFTNHAKPITLDDKIFTPIVCGTLSGNKFTNGIAISHEPLTSSCLLAFTSREITNQLSLSAIISASIRLYDIASNTILTNDTFSIAEIKDDGIITKLLLKNSVDNTREVSARFQAKCRATFCDSACGLKIEDYSTKVIISTIPNSKTITTQNNINAAQYEFGRAKCGPALLNIGEIDGNNITFLEDISSIVSIGAEITLYRICDKSFKTCKNTFANSINFRGMSNID